MYQGCWASFIQDSAVAWRGKSLHVLINKLVLAAVVFHLWHERNRRLFQQKRKRSWQVISDIEDDVRKRLQSISVINVARVVSELSKWGIIVEFPSIQTVVQ